MVCCFPLSEILNRDMTLAKKGKVNSLEFSLADILNDIRIIGYPDNRHFEDKEWPQ